MQREDKDMQLGRQVSDDSVALVLLKQVIKPCPYLTDFAWKSDHSPGSCQQKWRAQWQTGVSFGIYVCKVSACGLCHTTSLTHAVVSALKAKPQQTEDLVKS